MIVRYSLAYPGDSWRFSRTGCGSCNIVHIEDVAEDKRVLHKGMKGIFKVWPCRLSSGRIPGRPFDGDGQNATLGIRRGM